MGVILLIPCESHLPVLLGMGYIQESMLPGIISWPGAMKTKNPWAQLTGTTWTSTPSLQAIWRTSTPKDALDAAAWNPGPAAGSDHRPDEALIHPTIADQTPVDCGLYHMQVATRG
jgi:hypothetical protein